MDVVGHQPVRVDRDLVLAPVLDQFREIDLILDWTEKSLLSLVASDNDVVEDAGGGEQSRFAGHARWNYCAVRAIPR